MTSYLLTHTGERLVTQSGDTLIWNTIQGFAAVIASSSLTAAARRIGRGAAGIGVNASLSAAARRIARGSAAIAAITSIAQTGVVVRSANALIPASAVVQVQGRRRWEPCEPDCDTIWIAQPEFESHWE